MGIAKCTVRNLFEIGGIDSSNVRDRNRPELASGPPRNTTSVRKIARLFKKCVTKDIWGAYPRPGFKSIMEFLSVKTC